MGGAGFIGSAVVRLAVARGHSVVNLDALTYAACLEKADIRDAEALERFASVEDLIRRYEADREALAHFYGWITPSGSLRA